MITGNPEAPERSVEEQLAIPAVQRLIAAHPSVRTTVSDVLEAAAELRSARAAALPTGQPPTGEASTARRAAWAELESAVEAVERSAADPRLPVDAAAATVHRVMRAIMDVRVLGHLFGPPRITVGAAERTALITAIRRFAAAVDRLRREARSVGAARLPWQLEFASHIEPGTPVAEIVIDGYALPGTPVAARPWGERCALTGEVFAVDCNLDPVTRYRSLDSCSTALSAQARSIAQRLSIAAAQLGEMHPEAVRPLFELAPWLAETYVPCGANPGLTRLGLVDYPSLAVIANNLLRTFAELPFLGTRGPGGRYRAIGAANRADAVLDGAEPGYGWTTYGEIRDRALGLAHGFDESGVVGDGRVGIIADRNRVEFVLADLACVFSNRVSVGLLDTLNDETLRHIVRTAEVRTIVCDHRCAERLAGDRMRETCPDLKTLIVYGRTRELPDPKAGDLRVVPIDSVESPPAEVSETWVSASGIGPTTPVIHDDQEGTAFARSHGIADDTEASVYTLIFTSGTTDQPKGVVITRSQWTQVLRTEGGLWPHVEVSYQPSALGADRTVVWRTMAAGGRVGFGRRGAALLTDIEAIRPTVLEAPPAILNAFYGEFRLAVSDPALERPQLAVIRRRLRRNLGGRLAFLATGGAASEPVVRQTLGEVLGLPITEGYGTTETGTIATDGVIKPETDFRLVDVPEMGFTSADEPHPRGELAVRTPRTTTHYLAAAEADQSAFTDDGFFLTGDIVELVGDRRIRIIGRRKQFFKLAGAEFVYPDLLERHFMKSDLVRAVLVTGLPTAQSVVAVVVPAGDGIGAGEIEASFRAVARREGLRPFEVPAGVVVEPLVDGELPWTPANGLLTPSHKLCRRAIEAHYAAEIRAISDRGASHEDAASVESGAGECRHDELIRHLAANLLGIHPDDIEMDHSFSDHGGESLAAMELVLRLRHLLPPGEARRRATDPAMLTETPLAEVAGWLDGTSSEPIRPLGNAPSRPDAPPRPEPAAASSRPTAPAEDDTTLANSDAAWCGLPDELAPRSDAGGIFLTGATGFLGIHMAAELAAALEPGQRLFALVRARDDEAARRRLMDSMQRAGLETPAIDAGAAGSSPIAALAGSLEHDRFGLDAETYERLCSEVGLIHHVGASVTFEQGYGGLREPNVLGTRRVLQLATEGGLKAVHFVSSLNVAMLLETCGTRPAREDSELPAALPPNIVAKSLGYAVTKWAAERMVDGCYRAAAGRLRLSVSRPALITWSTATGFANESDWFSRLVLSCLEMRRAIGPAEAGIPRWAPLTEATARGLDLVPVDFAARAVCRLGELTRTGELPPADRVPTFHVSNIAPAQQGLITIEHLMDMLVAADLRCSEPGGGFSFLPLSDWLLDVEARGAPALPILPMLSAMNPSRPRTKADRFTEVMTSPGGPFAAECPAFDQSVVETFVRRVRGVDRPSEI
jgi:fatty acid CoA ligase FadD9